MFVCPAGRGGAILMDWSVDLQIRDASHSAGLGWVASFSVLPLETQLRCQRQEVKVTSSRKSRVWIDASSG